MTKNTFIVFACYFIILAFGCKKKDNSISAKYTSKMGGTRIWHGTNAETINGVKP